ncbi:MAG: IS3 family transposase [Bifidobacterium sp.]|jgi:transposase InsO family protein|nr:IS3 family transposase [Bifidobacterium sp.]
MSENHMAGAYTKGKYKPCSYKVNETPLPNILNREFNGYRPHAHIASDLTYVKVAGRWRYVCLLIDLHNRVIAGHSAGADRDADLVKAAFATLRFPLSDIEVFHTDRGSEFDNMKIDMLLDVFDIQRSLSRKGNPYDNAVVESTNQLLKRELIYRQRYTTLEQLRAELTAYIWLYNHERVHSTLNYQTPTEHTQQHPPPQHSPTNSCQSTRIIVPATPGRPRV